ncbi:MAG: Ig-like domain-containing protein [Verrucomicrobiota bacterium]
MRIGLGHSVSPLVGLVSVPVLLGMVLGEELIELDKQMTLGRPGGRRGTAPGWFDNPRMVSTDAGGRIYVGDLNNERMQVLDRAGSFLFAVDLDSVNADGSGVRGRLAPVGIDFGPDGTIYMADRGNNTVHVLDRTGTWQSNFGASGPAGRLFGPSGLTRVGDDVWVPSLVREYVMGLDIPSASTFVTYDSIRTPFRSWRPSGIDSDEDGVLYFTDSENERVHVMETSGNVLRSFGEAGEERGQLKNARDLSLGKNNLVYVIAETAEGRIEVYTRAGLHLTTILEDANGFSLEGTSGIHVRGDRLYLADDVLHSIHVFDVLLPEIRFLTEEGIRVTEGAPAPLVVHVERGGSVDHAWIAPIELSGEAVFGEDFTLEGSDGEEVAFAAGERTVSLRIVPVDDNLDEKDMTVILRLLQGDLYTPREGSSSVELTIEDDDFSPVAVEDSAYQVVEDGSITVGSSEGVLANDTDLDDGGGPANLRALLEKGPRHGSLDLNEDGGFVYAPGRDYFGEDSFRYRASDGDNLSEITEVFIEVVERADLSVEMNVLQDPVVAGGADVDVFRLNVTNQGPSDATGIRLTRSSIFPEGVSVVGTTISKGSFDGDEWLLDLAESESAFLSFELRAEAGTASGRDMVGLGFSSAADQQDPVSSNDSAFAAISVISAAEVGAGVTVAKTLERQSGLLVGKITVTNGNSVSIPAFRLLVDDLPDDVRLFNAAGDREGEESGETSPYLVYNRALAPGESVDLSVEFFRPSLDDGFVPRYSLELLPFAELEPLPADDGIPVSRRVVMGNGDFLIEIASVPGASYAVEYSDDMKIWKRVEPVLIAEGNRLQWIDNGPPKTESHPSAAGSRFYRFVLMETP